MTWRCSGCGESHEDSFDSCWRCGTPRSPSVRILTEEEVDARDEAELREEAEEADRLEAPQREMDRAVEAYQRDAGWKPEWTWNRSMDTGNALHRMAEAHRLYRERQERGAHAARPDLDRLWTQFLMTCAVVAGCALIAIIWVPAEALERNMPTFAFFCVVGLIACIVTGNRVVERELRAAAETAARQKEG
jgi:hypothetical protein